MAAAIGTPQEPDLREEVGRLRQDLAELRLATALLQDEVARLRAASPARRIVPFGAAESRARLS